MNLQAQNELKKFFSLIPEMTNIDDMKMPSCIVDEQWHKDIQNTESYTTLCQESVGTYIGHKKNGGVDQMAWVPKYEEKYGQLSKMWFTAKDGVFDKDGYYNYLQTGKMICSWDCTPYISDIVKQINDDIERLKDIQKINRKIDDISNSGVPELEKIKNINEDELIKTIKEKVDKFKIDEIKERNKK